MKQGPAAVREHALRLMGHTLVGATQLQQKDLEAMREAAGERNSYEIGQIAEALGAAQPQLMVEQFEKELERSAANRWSPQITLPDLVTLVGREKAEQLLRKALTARVQLRPSSGAETLKLARSLALDGAELSTLAFIRVS